MSPDEYSQLDVTTKLAVFDALIVIWNFKTRWDAVRPFSAIPFAMKDKFVPSYIPSNRTFGSLKVCPCLNWTVLTITFIYRFNGKVENILRGKLDLIPSPSPKMKIQIMGGKRQNFAGHCQKSFENKKFVDITQQCFALLPQVNFAAHNLNFHWRWRWWDWIQATF